MSPARPARRARVVLPLLAAGALLLGACTSTAVPGWTFEPPPSPTPAASGSAAPSASASASASAAATPAASASAGASGGAGGTSLQLTAQNIAFDKDALSAPAGQAFQIVFTNNDASVQHNVEIKDSGGNQVFKGDLLMGPGTATYNVPALTAGAYTFNCTVHPNMSGTLTVQ